MTVSPFLNFTRDLNIVASRTTPGERRQAVPG
jgi:hypothetical protein